MLISISSRSLHSGRTKWQVLTQKGACVHFVDDTASQTQVITTQSQTNIPDTITAVVHDAPSTSQTHIHLTKKVKTTKPSRKGKEVITTPTSIESPISASISYNDIPEVFQFRILGTVIDECLGDYGNWNPIEDVEWPQTTSVYSAALTLTLSIDEHTSECLKHLDYYGQLYVELSRGTNSQNIRILLGSNQAGLTNQTPNII